MKLKMGIFLIILSTAAIIGGMSLILDKTSGHEQPKTTNSSPKELPTEHALPKQQKVKTSLNDARPQEVDDDDDFVVDLSDYDGDKKLASTNADGDLSKEDIKKINSIVSLSENDLTRELNTLKEKIEEEDLFGKLEDGMLSDEKETEAKEVLERFALLGLEGTRRKYMAIEPELKDPIYAYKDSIKEIRELLNDGIEDDDEF